MAGKFYYDRKKKIQSSFWRVRDHYYDRKKKDTVVCLMGYAVVLFFVVAGNFDYDRKKKIQSSVWRVRDEFVLVLVKIDLIHFEH